MGLRLAVTADLHWGHRHGGGAVRRLADFLRADPPDVLLIAGDIGTGGWFGQCLAEFADLPCSKALVPGNHDLWVPRGGSVDSLTIYEEVLPRTAAAHGFHYLDAGPLYFRDEGLAVVGSVNWYDYSWSADELRRRYPDEVGRLASKRFTRGQHNDANFVRWPLDDVSFTARVVAAFERQLGAALAEVPRAIVVTHHPAYYDLGFERAEPPTQLDSLLWDALCGNRALEDVLARHAGQVTLAFSGHTHRARQATFRGIRGYNVGGDYHFKRLLLVDWPAGTVAAHEFGEPAA